MPIAQIQPSFRDRVRFNWGFHDGSYDYMRHQLRDMDKHFDAAYSAGYRAGQAECKNAGSRPETSDNAWAAHVSKPRH